MLTLTEQAAEAVRLMISEWRSAPDTAGLRIHAARATEFELALRLTLAEEPAVADRLVEQEGARLFLDPIVASELDDKVLDVVHEEGRLQFSIRKRD
jgi:iron-sulfur cluster assembly protein